MFSSQIVTQNDGFSVVWDGGPNVDVAVPQSYRETRPLCGLCGRYDGDEANDFTKPDDTVVSQNGY